MITQELKDKGITCRGQGFNCYGCKDKNECVDYIPFVDIESDEEMTEEKLFNIVIFRWRDWDDIASDINQYYKVQWNLKELEKYNNRIITVNSNWDVEIYDIKGVEIEKEFNIIDIQEFRDLIKS